MFSIQICMVFHISVPLYIRKIVGIIANPRGDLKLNGLAFNLLYEMLEF